MYVVDCIVYVVDCFYGVFFEMEFDCDGDVVVLYFGVDMFDVL